MARRVGLAQLAELARLGPPPVSTYSIVACDRDSRQWGVATQSKFLAVGSVVPWAEAEVGVVDASGGAATFTGGECQDWAGGRTGDGYAAQGNILVDGVTVDALASTFESTQDKPLAERLIECLAAAQLAGGDRRGQQSAALLVVEKDAGYAKLSDVVVDLRVDDHEHPIDELRRLYRLHDDLFGQTPRALWVDVGEPLQTELMERLTQLGHSGTFEEALNAWAGTENYEMRVDGVEQIDPVVLEALRGQT